MGSYADWDEETRIEFLTRELEGKRPLIPPAMPMTNDVREVQSFMSIVDSMPHVPCQHYPATVTICHHCTIVCCLHRLTIPA